MLFECTNLHASIEKGILRGFGHIEKMNERILNIHSVELTMSLRGRYARRRCAISQA